MALRPAKNPNISFDGEVNSNNSADGKVNPNIPVDGEVKLNLLELHSRWRLHTFAQSRKAGIQVLSWPCPGLW